jgi:hypothetical protein
MKALGLLKFVGLFFKMTLLGVPMWVTTSMLALVALLAVYGYRRSKKRSEDHSAGELAD